MNEQEEKKQQDVQTRLKEASETCLKCHEAWDKDKKDVRSREKIMEAVHELRKVAARMEIEIAVSERDQMTSKPIPIPSHRAAQGRGGQQNDDNVGNREGSNKSRSQSKPSAPRKLPPRKPKTGTKPSE